MIRFTAMGKRSVWAAGLALAILAQPGIGSAHSLAFKTATNSPGLGGSGISARIKSAGLGGSGIGAMSSPGLGGSGISARMKSVGLGGSGIRVSRRGH
jgi:hypothetical protein